jgi:hypothetical protein
MARGAIIHVYEDQYPQCFFREIGKTEYKPERFARGKQDHTLDHHGGKKGHLDPEWNYFTYEDLPSGSPKARLKDLGKGDYIFFNCKLRQCESWTRLNQCEQADNRGKVVYYSNCPRCKENGEIRWYVIGYFRLREKPKTTKELIETGKIKKSPYKYNDCVEDGSYKTRIEERYIFAGSRGSSKRLTNPFPLPISGKKYGIIRKKMKGSVHWKLSHTYRSAFIKDDGVKRLLTDIESFSKIRG